MSCTCVITIISYCKCSAVMLYVLVKSGVTNSFFFSVKRLLEKANTGWKFLEVEKAKNF